MRQDIVSLFETHCNKWHENEQRFIYNGLIRMMKIFSDERR